MRAVVAYLADTELEERRFLTDFSALTEKGIHLLVLRADSTPKEGDSVTVLSPPPFLSSGAIQKVAFEFAFERAFDLLCVIESGNLPSVAELFEYLSSFPEDAAAIYAVRGRKQERFLHRIAGQFVRMMNSALIGRKILDIHSAYRIYRLPLIVSLPIDQNSDSRAFLSEITVQLVLAGLSLREVSSTVQARPYSWNHLAKEAVSLLGIAFKQRVQRLGILYDTRFDLSRENEYYPDKFDFPSSHSFALATISSADRVLLLGSGPAELVRPFVKRSPHIVAIDQYAAPALRSICVEAQDIDLNAATEIQSTVPAFEKVLALDIIEHLVSPERFLSMLRNSDCTSASKLVLTTPNIAFFPMRLMLLAGQFNYGKRGILDRTHTRLFTFRSLRRLLEQSGFRVIEMKGIPAPFPLACGRGGLANALLALNLSLIQIARGMFSFQIYVEAVPIPTVRQLLSMSKHKASGINDATSREHRAR